MHKKAYELYKQNISLKEIAIILGVSRQTVSNWKKKEKWDELLLSEQSIDAENKEKEFLLELIKEWDRALIELKESDLANKLTLLEKYTKTYYKLKNINSASKSALKIKKEDIAKKIILKISNLAIEKKEKSVAEFLSKNADEIIGIIDD